jgi:hypothetical protein
VILNFVSLDAAWLQYSQVASLPKADSGTLKHLRLWVQRMGGSPIQGSGAHSWGDWSDPNPPKSLRVQFLHLIVTLFWAPESQGNDLDLVVPFPGFRVDSFTRWVADEFYVCYHNLRKQFEGKAEDGNIELGRSEGFEPPNEHTALNISKIR